MWPGRYGLSVMSLDGGDVKSSAGLEVVTRPATSDALDTLVIVGGGETENFPSGLSDFVMAASASVRRLAGVSTGVFLLAEAGLLDGRRAAIAAQLSAALQSRHADIRINCGRSFIHDHGLWTAADAASGMELSLALIEEDLGRETSTLLAAMLPIHRLGGSRSQYSPLLDQSFESGPVHQVLGFASGHLGDPLPDEILADVAHLSAAELRQEFLAATGLTPDKAVERLRAETARRKVQDGRESFTSIAKSVGFRDTEDMRRGFLRVFGQSPQALRRGARLAGASRKADAGRRVTWPGALVPGNRMLDRRS